MEGAMTTTTEAANVSGLCMCGCGQRTLLSDSNRPERGWVKGEHRRFLRGHESRVRVGVLVKAREHLIGSRTARWNGGRKTVKGRVTHQVGVGHPMADKDGYVLEYRLLMAGVVGRYLRTDEHVHHINNDHTDNSVGNLIVVTPSQHSRIHALMRAGTAPEEAMSRVVG